MIRKEELVLTNDWDKTFPKSEKVDHSKVTFVNRYGITLAADMYVPNFRLSLFQAPSAQLRSSAPACTPRRWRSADF